MVNMCVCVCVCVCVWGGGSNDMEGFTKLVTEQQRLGRNIVAEERQFGGQGRSPGIFLNFAHFNTWKENF